MFRIAMCMYTIIATVCLIASMCAIRETNEKLNSLTREHVKLKEYAEQLCAEQRAMQYDLSNYFWEIGHGK